MILKRLIPMLAAIAACSASVHPAPPPPLSTLHAVHSLSNEEAGRRLPVAFEATVTYFRSYQGTMFVEDGNEALYVEAHTTQPIEPGDRVLVRGITLADFRPGVIGHEITLLHHGNLPTPIPATFAEMISGAVDCRYVVVRGIVRSANLVLTSNRPVTQLELATPGAYVGVTMDNSDPAQLKGWLDSEVEVTGVAGGRFDGKMQQVGILMHATSAQDLRVLRPAARDPWALPATPMNQVISHSDVEERTPPVRVEGTLTYYQPGEMAVLQDGNRSIQVFTQQIDLLPIGSHVEAIGIPYVDDGFLTLRLGTLRNSGTAAPIAPAAVDSNDLASGKHAFDLVSMEGTVVVQVREESQDIYVISNNGRLFSAVVRHPFSSSWIQDHPLPIFRSIATGTRVRVTGVAILDDGNPFNGAIAFSILLRSTDDLVVVGSPSLLNVPNLIFLAGMLLAAVLAVGARGWYVERDMRRHTSNLAYIEQRRSRILEAMHARRPLKEILEEITELVSFRLDGAPCWCRVADGATVGNRPAEISPAMCVVDCAITSPSGRSLGTLHSAIFLRTHSRATAEQALLMASGLATLAIETSHLHSVLVHRSEFDLLTDIQNRFSLEQSLDALIESARQSAGIFGLIYIDLNRFKQVNDNYGHRAGDIYLQQAAERMKRQLRPGDTLARMGGDEFAVLVPAVRNRTVAEDIALRLQFCFDDPFSLEGKLIEGSASIGIALYPEDATTKDGLLNAADVAMYAAKHSRRRVETMLEESAQEGIHAAGI
jgi:diguanylate cyclase (GGDEF)-like protein